MTMFGDRDDILRHARQQATARAQAAAIARSMAADDAPPRDSEAAVRRWVALGLTMTAGGNITASESVMFLTFAIEGLHTKRWLAGDYPEIEAISAEMAAIERAAGLCADPDGRRDDAPDDHRQLGVRYEAALDARFEDALRSFGLDTLADLWRDDREEYDRLREIGRRSIFAKDERLTAIGSAIPLYEGEAMKSAGAGAFYAATVMIGSAAEARLLERFLAHAAATAAALASMTGAEKPGKTDPLRWTLAEMLAVADRAGWLGVIEDETVGADIRPWLSSLRETRNLLHPGRHVRDRPHITIGSAEYEDAKLGYAALCLALSRTADDDVRP